MPGPVNLRIPGHALKRHQGDTALRLHEEVGSKRVLAAVRESRPSAEPSMMILKSTRMPAEAFNASFMAWSRPECGTVQSGAGDVLKNW